jgi:hypothetical protein
MTKTEQQRIALALLGARPVVLPGTRVIVDAVERAVWYRCVVTLAVALYPDGQPPKWFFDAAGVSE